MRTLLHLRDVPRTLGRLAPGAGLAVAGLLTLATASAASSASVAIMQLGPQCTSEFCFVPSSLQVPVGTTVTWRNQTGASHTVTRCNASNCSGNSGGTGTQPGFGTTSSIAPAGTYAFTFTQPGTYNYYCAIHTYSVMHGAITVTGSAASAAPATATARPATGGGAPATQPLQPPGTGAGLEGGRAVLAGVLIVAGLAVFGVGFQRRRRRRPS